jgi:hypothetical protein
MRAHGPLADPERSSDPLVGLTRTDEADDLKLARSQVGRRVFMLDNPERLDEPSGNSGIELNLAALCGTNRVRYLVGVGVLEEVAGCARLQRGVHSFIVAERRQSHHLDVVVPRADSSGRLDSVHRLHLQVHEDDLRPKPLLVETRDELERFLASGSVTDDLEVGLGAEKCEETTPYDLMIVDENYANRIAGFSVH